MRARCFAPDNLLRRSIATVIGIGRDRVTDYLNRLPAAAKGRVGASAVKNVGLGCVFEETDQMRSVFVGRESHNITNAAVSASYALAHSLHKA